MALQKMNELIARRVSTNGRSVKDFLSKFHSLLITSIDSTTEIAASRIGERLISADPDSWFLGSAVVVPGKNIARLDQALNLFNGFDELWCFSRKPKLAKPKDVWLVAPLNMESDAISPELRDWMVASGCQLGLGDGEGLNFITPLRETADLLVRGPS
jgi:hypothetical protein